MNGLKRQNWMREDKHVRQNSANKVTFCSNKSIMVCIKQRSLI